MKDMWILAQAGEDEGPSTIPSTPVTGDEQETTTGTKAASDPNLAGDKERTQGLFGPYGKFILPAMLCVMFYLIIFRGPRKKQQQHKQMVQSLERNDRIRTIGGILGTVVDVKDDEITLKIDESNNTKIKITLSAVGRNLTKDKG